MLSSLVPYLTRLPKETLSMETVNASLSRLPLRSTTSAPLAEPHRAAP
jgi:hypothetical protein